MGSAMAYFCRLYISSEALTLDFMLCDLFALKSFFKKKKIRCVQVCACVRLDVQVCLIYVFHHPKALSQLPWRWDTGVSVAPQTPVMSSWYRKKKWFPLKIPLACRDT